MAKRQSMFQPLTPNNNLGQILKDQNTLPTIDENQDQVQPSPEKELIPPAAPITPKKEKIVTPNKNEDQELIKQIKSKSSKELAQKIKGGKKEKNNSSIVKQHVLVGGKTNYYIKMRKTQLGLANAEDVLKLAFDSLDKELDKKFGKIIYPENL